MSAPEAGRFGYPPAAEQFWVRQAEAATELGIALGALALVVDDHDVAGDAHLVAVRGRIVERDGCDRARIGGISDIDDRGAEVGLVGIFGIGALAVQDLAQIGRWRQRHIEAAAGEQHAQHARQHRPCRAC